MSVTHAFVSNKTDGSDDTVVRPSNWNAPHVVDNSGKGFLLQGNPSTGVVESTFTNFVTVPLPTDSLTTAPGAKSDVVIGSGVPSGILIGSVGGYTGDGIPVLVQAFISGGSVHATIGNAGSDPLSDVVNLNFVIFTSD